MGLSGKHNQGDGLFESSEGKRWVIAGIPLRSPLKPIYTASTTEKGLDNDGEEKCSTTPTSEEARIKSRMTCPPAPRKRKPSSKCNNYRRVTEFFTPPDLETVFIRRHVEKAN